MADKRIYLDNAATTRVAEEVLQEMLPCFRESYANPSAIYGFAGEAKKGGRDCQRAGGIADRGEAERDLFHGGRQ